MPRIREEYPSVKFSRIVTLGICLGILLVPGMSRADTERILSFNSKIDIHADGNIRVTDTIRIVAAGQRIRRGIYREFPTRYRNNLGIPVTVSFDVLEVQRDGRPEAYHTEPWGDGTRVYIGSKNVLLKPGVYTYTLVYRTNQQVGFFDDYDELYWNVTGNDWEFPIEKVRAVIELPPGAKSIRSIAYTGPEGARGKDYTLTEDDIYVEFATVRRLKIGEGLTIAVSWPKGFVAKPTFLQKISLYVPFDRELLGCSVFLVLIILYYVVVWLKVGKDPVKSTIIPRYTPPENISPAAARFLTTMDYDADFAALAATIISMATNGLLAIEEDDEGGFSLVALADTDTISLNAEESAVVGKLFSAKRRRLPLHDSAKNYIKEVNDARQALHKVLEAQFGKGKGYFSRNNSYSSTGCLFSVLFIAGLFWYVVSGLSTASSEDKIVITFSLLIWTMGFYAGFSVAYRNWLAGKKVGTITGTLFSLPFAAWALLLMFQQNVYISPVILFTLMIVPILNYIFSMLMKAPSPAGQQILDSLEGFKLYLSVAESERMNMLNSPKETPELFAQCLPYAMALGVEQQWSERFEHILAQSQYRPSWYRSASSATRFDQVLSSSFSSALASAGTQPGSTSGSGGSGSSGGGGGGGGGGGW